MTIVRCDRCKADMGQPDGRHTVLKFNIANSTGSVDVEMDLCRQCMRSFEYWKDNPTSMSVDAA